MLANLFIFAYMAAILNFNMEWSLMEYCSHRCPEMLSCMMISLRDSCALKHLEKRAIHVGSHDPSILNDEEIIDRAKTPVALSRFKTLRATCPCTIIQF